MALFQGISVVYRVRLPEEAGPEPFEFECVDENATWRQRGEMGPMKLPYRTTTRRTGRSKVLKNFGRGC